MKVNVNEEVKAITGDTMKFVRDNGEEFYLPLYEVIMNSLINEEAKVEKSVDEKRKQYEISHQAIQASKGDGIVDFREEEVGIILKWVAKAYNTHIFGYVDSVLRNGNVEEKTTDK